MQKRELPQEEWKTFFEMFNEKNKGRMAYIEITDDEHYRHEYSESIAFDRVGMNIIDNDHITVSITAGEDSIFKQFVDRIERIIVESESGTDRELHIFSSLGRRAVIRFHGR